MQTKLMNAIDTYAQALGRVVQAEESGDSDEKIASLHEAKRQARDAVQAMLVAAAPQGVPVAWRYQTPTGWHATTDADSAIRVNAHHTIEPLYTHPTQQGFELHPNDVIRLAGEVGLNVYRGDGWPDEPLIAKMVKFAAQAKQGGAA